MFELNCEIKIDNLVIRSVHSVKIKRSIYNPSATATIQIPVTASLKQSGEPATYVETASKLSVGQKVEIRLGYDNQLRTEFTGYIKGLNYKVPLEIECEDEFFLLRQESYSFSARMVTLKEFLQTLFPAIKIAYCTELQLKNMAVLHKSAGEIFSQLKQDYGLSLFFDVSGQLYACKTYEVVGEKVKYRIGYNVIKSDDLKFREAADHPLKVTAICFYKNGDRVEGVAGLLQAPAGKKLEEKTIYFYDVEDVEQLAALAKEEYNRYSYDGYEGKLQAFLAPHALPGMVAEIEDKVYPEREGSYYIETTEVTFGLQGGRRNIEIGRKI